MNVKKFFYKLLGCISVGMGAIGAAVPVLPTVPFLMLAAFCFAKSSDKLYRRFQNTKLYQENLADFAEGKGMTGKTKCRIMVTVTILMAIGFLVMGMKGIVARCIVLGGVWMLHLLYFIFGVKTIPVTEEEDKEKKV